MSRQLHAPAALPPKKSLRYPLDRRLSESQSCCGHSDSGDNICAIPEIEPESSGS
jgi:hypothetical protein